MKAKSGGISWSVVCGTVAGLLVGAIAGAPIGEQLRQAVGVEARDWIGPVATLLAGFIGFGAVAYNLYAVQTRTSKREESDARSLGRLLSRDSAVSAARLSSMMPFVAIASANPGDACFGTSIYKTAIEELRHLPDLSNTIFNNSGVRLAQLPDEILDSIILSNEIASLVATDLKRHTEKEAVALTDFKWLAKAITLLCICRKYCNTWSESGDVPNRETPSNMEKFAEAHALDAVTSFRHDLKNQEQQAPLAQTDVRFGLRVAIARLDLVEIKVKNGWFKNLFAE